MSVPVFHFSRVQYTFQYRELGTFPAGGARELEPFPAGGAGSWERSQLVAPGSWERARVVRARKPKIHVFNFFFLLKARP